MKLLWGEKFKKKIKEDQFILAVIAGILFIFFLFLLFFNFKYLPNVQGDVHLVYDPSLRAGTGRYLTNFLILNFAAFFRTLFNIDEIYSYYILQFAMSISLVVVSFFVVRHLTNVKIAYLYAILMLSSNFYLTLTYGFEYHRFYGLFFFWLAIFILVKFKNVLLFSIILVVSLLFSTAMAPVIAIFVLSYFILILINKDFQTLKSFLIVWLIFFLSAIVLFVIFYFILKQEELHNWIYYLIENMGQGKKYTNISMLPSILRYFYVFEGKVKTIFFIILLPIGLFYISKFYFIEKEYELKSFILFMIVPITVPIIMLVLNFTIIARLFFVVFPSVVVILCYGIYYIFFYSKFSLFKYKSFVFYILLTFSLVISIRNQLNTFNAFHVSGKVDNFIKSRGKDKVIIPTESIEFLPRTSVKFETVDISDSSSFDKYASDDLVMVQPYHFFKRDDSLTDAEAKYKFYVSLDSVAEFYDVSSLKFYYLHAEGLINFLINGVFYINAPMRLRLVTVEEFKLKYSFIKDIKFYGEEDLSPYKF